jgi:hypothetical protein
MGRKNFEHGFLSEGAQMVQGSVVHRKKNHSTTFNSYCKSIPLRLTASNDSGIHTDATLIVESDSFRDTPEGCLSVGGSFKSLSSSAAFIRARAERAKRDRQVTISYREKSVSEAESAIVSDDDISKPKESLRISEGSWGRPEMFETMKVDLEDEEDIVNLLEQKYKQLTEREDVEIAKVDLKEMTEEVGSIATQGGKEFATLDAVNMAWEIAERKFF